MSQNGLPDEMATLVVNNGEDIWVNLYPNALCNIKRAIKTHLDERIGKYCSKNNGILLSYTGMKFRAKHFQVFEDNPVCRFPVSVTATYYKPDPGTIATGVITRVDHISVTCLIHGMIHVTIPLRKSVNFDTWCAPGQQIIFEIRGGEMHYKGVRLNAIVTDECVERMRVAFPLKGIGARKRKLSSSSTESSLVTPVKRKPPLPEMNIEADNSMKQSKRKKIKSNESCDSLSTFEENREDYLVDFGSPRLTSTQIKPNRKSIYDDDQQIVSPTFDDEEPSLRDIKVEYSSHEESASPLRTKKKKSKKHMMAADEDSYDF